MFDLNTLPFIHLEHNIDGRRYPTAPSNEEAFRLGDEMRKAGKDTPIKELEARRKFHRLSTETPQETNRLFLESLQDSLLENILSLKALSELNQRNNSNENILNEEKAALLNNLKKAQSLGLLRVIPDLKEESGTEFTRGEIKLHRSIDPSYSVSSGDRSKLYFMLMNNENSQLVSKPLLRIFSDERNRQNPFYHLNIEFTGTPKKNISLVNTLFRNTNKAETRLEFEESRNRHSRVLKLFQAENNISEYLFEHKLGKKASPKDNLNLLKSIVDLLLVQKSQPTARSGQIESGEAFEGKPFYKDKLVNTSRKPLDFHTGFISTENLEIQFLIFNDKERKTIPKLNLKLTDTMRGHSKLLLLDAEKFPELRDDFQTYLNSFLSFIQKKESKLIAPNLPKLKKPNPPPFHA